MFMLPTPKSFKRTDGDFVFADKLFLTIPEKIAEERFVPYYKDLVKGYTAGKTRLEVVFSNKLSSVAYITKEPIDLDAKKSTENDYELTVSQNEIEMVFNDEIGFSHAFTSFLQLIRIKKDHLKVQAFEIKDKPDMNFRAVHLCVFHSTTLDFLKKALSLCGIMKCSHVVIEFWGMYRFECCPSLSWKEAYTKNEIKPLIDYANALGIEIIPMLNHLGHASQARIVSGKHSTLDNDLSLAYLFEEDGWSWCTSCPDTLALLADCRKELIELCGKGSYFHIGCDEAYTFGSCEECSKKTRGELMKEHLLNITNDLLACGRRPIMWADMLFNKADFDSAYQVYGKGEYKILSELPKDIIMADWQYTVTDEFETSKHLSKNGFDVVSCPWNSVKNVSAAIKTASNNSLYGVLGTTWHTLSHMQWLIPFLGDKMWCKDNVVSDMEYPLYCAYTIRRCVPANGEYEKAGFIEQELTGRML